MYHVDYELYLGDAYPIIMLFIQDVPRGMPTLVSLRDGRWKEVRHILTPTFSLLKLKSVSSHN